MLVFGLFTKVQLVSNVFIERLPTLNLVCFYSVKEIEAGRTIGVSHRSQNSLLIKFHRDFTDQQVSSIPHTHTSLVQSLIWLILFNGSVLAGKIGLRFRRTRSAHASAWLNHSKLLLKCVNCALNGDKFSPFPKKQHGSFPSLIFDKVREKRNIIVHVKSTMLQGWSHAQSLRCSFGVLGFF